MDFSRPVISRIPVLFIFGVRCLNLHGETWTSLRPARNNSIPVLDQCILFAPAPVQSEKNESAAAYGGLSTIKCQHHVAAMAYPPHLEQQEKRVTTDIKHVLTFGWYEAVTAACHRNMWHRVVVMEFFLKT